MKLSKIQVPFGQVPNQVMYDPNISLKAKGLFAYFQCKPDDWNFSVKNIAKELAEGERSIRNAINELEEQNYLERQKQQSGYMVYILKLPTHIAETATLQNVLQDETQGYIKKELNTYKERTTTNVVGENIVDLAETANQPSYGNEEINWLLAEFYRIMGFKSSGKKDRIFARHVLNNFSRLQVQGLLTFCAQHEYAPRIGSVEKLWFKRGDILAGIKKIKNNSNKIRSL